MSANYVMPVKAIKRIMTGEIENTKTALIRGGSSQGVDREKVYYLFSLLSDEFKSIETYEQLESFCNGFYRMTLEQWIQSL